MNSEGQKIEKIIILVTYHTKIMALRCSPSFNELKTLKKTVMSCLLLETYRTNMSGGPGV